MWHPGLKEVRARRVCAKCGLYRPQKDMRCDHIEPVVALTGFVDWNTYIARMFDAIPDGIQYLCKPCHDLKSAEERGKRKEWRGKTKTTASSA